MSNGTSEYYSLLNTMKKYFNKLLQEISPNSKIQIATETMYDALKEKTHIFHFKIEKIMKLTEWSYNVQFTLHEYASETMRDITQIGILMKLPYRMVISQTKVDGGFMFSTDSINYNFNIKELANIGDNAPIKSIDLDINSEEDLSV